MGPPEEICVEAVEQFLECTAVGLPFHAGLATGSNRDHAVFNGGVADIFLVHQKKASQGF